MKGELGTSHQDCVISIFNVGYRSAGREGPRSVMEKLFTKRINIMHQTEALRPQRMGPLFDSTREPLRCEFVVELTLVYGRYMVDITIEFYGLWMFMVDF